MYTYYVGLLKEFFCILNINLCMFSFLFDIAPEKLEKQKLILPI